MKSLTTLLLLASPFVANAVAQVVPASQAGTGMRETFKLLDAPVPWVIVLVVIPACALLAWFSYRSEPITPRARMFLTVLRTAAFLLLFTVLFRPVFVQRREEVRPAEVVILADDSASMRRKDDYAGDERARRGLESLIGKPPAEAMRVELERAALDGVLLPHLKSKGYTARLFSFADVLEPLSEPSALTGRGHATYLGDALQAALASHRGRHVTDIVVVSDGRSNGGLPALEAARTAAAAGIPVHTLVVGDTRPEKNLVIELSEAPTSVLDGDEIAVSVRVLARGISGGGRARVVLEEMRSDGGNPRPITEADVEMDEKGTKAVLVAPPGTPDSDTNERRFKVRVEPLPDETLKDDNAVLFSVRVNPEKIRVLYVDAYPRYEYRFLKELLKRSDANIDVQVFLLSATPDFVQESTRGLPPLTSVPTGRKELLDNYDVVILGDVNPYSISPDPARCEEFMASMREFVERGGGAIFIAGEHDNPLDYVGTPLGELLPVIADATTRNVNAEVDSVNGFRPVVEDGAAPHEVVRLVPDPKINRALWEDEGGLYGCYWFFPVARAKPGAQVLLRHPSASNAHGRFPLLVAGYFPAGRTLFTAIDETWRWRYRFGDRYHERFWRNSIRWVALGRLKSGDRRVQIDASKSSYDLDERVVLEARVLDEDYRPSERPAVPVRLQHPDGKTTDVTLGLLPERAGVYRTAFDVERSGTYSAFVENEGARVASVDFEVVLPSRENADPSPDPDTLKSLAALTKGRGETLPRVRELLDAFPGGKEQRQPISSELRDAWDHWGTLIAALILLTIEWVARKRLELI
ncbi:MAG: hypothetical protein JNL28_15915 [Planctomycetes bacterium]|nr:hypothetical protein [Planctomycetota bacterium]